MFLIIKLKITPYLPYVSYTEDKIFGDNINNNNNNVRYTNLTLISISSTQSNAILSINLFYKL